MPDQDRVVLRTATVEDRVDAIQAALDAKGLKASEAIEELGHKAQEEWLPRNGARMVARAWSIPISASGCSPTGAMPPSRWDSPCPSTIATWWCWRTRLRCRT